MFDFLERVINGVENAADEIADDFEDAFNWTRDRVDSVIDLFDIGGPDHKVTSVLEDLDDEDH